MARRMDRNAWVKHKYRGFYRDASDEDRALLDYLERAYLPAADKLRALDGSTHDGARQLAEWKRRIRDCWDRVRVASLWSDQPAVRVGDGLEVLNFCVTGYNITQAVEARGVGLAGVPEQNSGCGLDEGEREKESAQDGSDDGERHRPEHLPLE